jgi:AAA+ superfamily predicted ATPase
VIFAVTEQRHRPPRFGPVGQNDGVDPLLESLLAAVAARPDDGPLRLHVAGLLLDGGHPEQALTHVSAVLAVTPTDRAALDLLARASAALGDRGSDPAAPPKPAAAPAGGFDWAAAETQVGDIVEPAFVDDPEASGGYDVERPSLRLADVGGMDAVKERLDAAFLLPLRNPELRKAYGKSLRGGLLLYGPPGCGKTYLARALAGELGARLMTVGLPDVLDMYVGNSEKNLHGIFEVARRAAPCVLFLDEVDALGQKRSLTRGSAMRGAVNQLLVEMDDVHAANDGVFVLAATNHPWDVDPALRRPGRLDRTAFVGPPDADARAAIFKVHLRDRPVAGIELGRLAAETEGFSGADVAHVCETATEKAMVDSARTGEIRPIGMPDLQAALSEVRPSTGPWFDVARNVAEFGNDEGAYDELAAYLRTRRRRR